MVVSKANRAVSSVMLVLIESGAVAIGNSTRRGYILDIKSNTHTPGTLQTSASKTRGVKSKERECLVEK